MKRNDRAPDVTAAHFYAAGWKAWDPPGPFAVEVDEIGAGWDCVAAFPTLLEASRHASRLLVRDWTLRRDERRARIIGPDGRTW